MFRPCVKANLLFGSRSLDFFTINYSAPAYQGSTCTYNRQQTPTFSVKPLTDHLWDILHWLVTFSRDRNFVLLLSMKIFHARDFSLSLQLAITGIKDWRVISDRWDPRDTGSPIQVRELTGRTPRSARVFIERESRSFAPRVAMHTLWRTCRWLSSACMYAGVYVIYSKYFASARTRVINRSRYFLRSPTDSLSDRVICRFSERPSLGTGSG